MTEITQQLSEEYLRLYYLYESLCDKETGPIEDYAVYLQIRNHSASVATYESWRKFNIKKGARTLTNSYGHSNYFYDNAEAKSKEIFINSLNNYIRRLEYTRNSYYKLASLYCYMIQMGLYSVLTEIYIPATIKPQVDQMIDDINNRLDHSLTDIQDYFAKRGDEKLMRTLKIMGHYIVSQRTDQVVQKLRNAGFDITEDDYYFIQDCRSEYLKFVTGPTLTYSKQAFGISDGSFRGNVNKIIQDLTEILSDDQIELLTELFVRN